MNHHPDDCTCSACCAPAPKQPSPKPRLRRDKRATAIRNAMRKIRAERYRKGLNSVGNPIGNRAKFRNRKYQ